MTIFETILNCLLDDDLRSLHQ